MKVILTESQLKNIISRINEDEYSDMFNNITKQYIDAHRIKNTSNDNVSTDTTTQTDSTTTPTNNNVTKSNDNSSTSNTKSNNTTTTNTNQTFSGNKCHMELVNTEKSSKHTLSKLMVNGQYVCDVLEDAIREKKIPHETAIPAGTYKVVLTTSSKFSRQSFYKKADGGLVPWVKNVPNFSGIMIHCGTNVSHTWGCLLLGTSKGPNTMKLVKSHEAWEKLMVNYLCPAWEKKIPIDITIKR